ncbi:hypothetical protein DLM20_24520, partial [Salmonella enterica subsp. enterica serovar Java]|nr:hypothetical protein [Salmonella enterica subsp. enterica serovar Java]
LDQSSADLGERPSWTTETANDQQIGAGYLDIEMQDEWETEVRIGFIKMAHDYGLTALDIDSGLIHYADGYRGIVLDQGDEIIVSPTEEQIRDAVAAMTPDGGPSILILDRAPDNYMQVAGGDGTYVVEMREPVGNRFRHWCVGRQPTGNSKKKVKVLTDGYKVVVYANEKLSADHVCEILIEYGAEKGRSSHHHWRDMTKEFE